MKIGWRGEDRCWSWSPVPPLDVTGGPRACAVRLGDFETKGCCFRYNERISLVCRVYVAVESSSLCVSRDEERRENRLSLEFFVKRKAVDGAMTIATT